VATDAADEHAQARRLGARVSVWHYLMAIAVVPCVGVAALAGLIVTNVARDAADARRIERTMVSIQRLDDLNRANSGEATAVAIGNTLAALGVTAVQVRQLAGFVLTTTPAEAAATADAALAAVREDPSMSDAVTRIVARLTVARRGATAGAGATGDAARARAWASIQDYRAVTRAITAAQGTAVDSVVTGRSGAGSREVLRAADQLRTVSDLALLGVIRSSDYYLTFLAPASELPDVRAELRDADAAYRLASAGAAAHLSPALWQAWREFATSSSVTLLDRYVAGNVDVSSDRAPPLRDLYLTARSLSDYGTGLSDLLAAAVAEGRAAAAQDRAAASRRTRLTMAGTGVVLALTLGSLVVLGGQIRRRLTGVADAARRLSSGRLEPIRVRGPREIAVASAGLNDAVASLRQMTATAERLAAGDLGSPELRRATPGPLGEAVHASVVLLTDAIRERERLQQELKRQAAHDSLTGLPNRAEAERLLTAALARGGRVGLLFVDLDHFKQVNDSHGHHAGDHVLQISAARMASEVRDSDTVCRLGGDEFVVILEPVESDQVVTRIGERIVAALGRPIAYEGNELRVGASVGAAVSDPPGGDPEELLSRADHAVYRAKASGRNSLAF
jgi:diguanylate cyclase (GGDEF)-like protein